MARNDLGILTWPALVKRREAFTAIPGIDNEYDGEDRLGRVKQSDRPREVTDGPSEGKGGPDGKEMLRNPVSKVRVGKN